MFFQIRLISYNNFVWILIAFSTKLTFLKILIPISILKFISFSYSNFYRTFFTNEKRVSINFNILIIFQAHFAPTFTSSSCFSIFSPGSVIRTLWLTLARQVPPSYLYNLCYVLQRCSLVISCVRHILKVKILNCIN